MDPNELGVCWDLLSWASAESDKQQENENYSRRLGEVIMAASTRFKRIGTNELASLREKNRNKLEFPRNRSLLLAADTKGQWKIPILNVTHDCVNSHEIIRYQVCLIVLEGNGRGDQVAGEIGLRFETPEGPNGIHGYYHAQWCRDFREQVPGGFRKCPDWLPDIHPAIPVAADGPLSLMVALFVSLYGRDIANRLKRELPHDCRGNVCLKKLLG